MLTGKNVVMIEGKPGKVYEREYFTHDANDKTETYKKTSKGNIVQVDGKDFEGIRPAEDSKAPVEELVQAALNRLVERYPLKVEALKDDATTEQKAEREKLIADYPWRLALSALDYGAELWMVGKIRADLTPTKPVDKATAIKKMAKLMGISEAKATKMYEMSQEEETEPAAA